MYTRFQIQNFKGFKNLEFDDLARVNLLAGKNNTGKTSVLEAIALHSGNIRKEQLFRNISGPNWSFLFFDNQDGTEIVLNGVFKEQVGYEVGDESRFDTEWTLVIERQHREFIAKQFISSDETQGVPEWLEQDKFHGDFSWLPLLPVHFLPTSGGIDAETKDAEWYSALELRNQVDFLMEALHLVEPRLQKLRPIVKNNRFAVYGWIESDLFLPISLMGEGLQTLMRLLLAIGISSKGVVLIDEIENGLHHSILPDVWRAIDRASELFNVQVFATTHSYEVIRAAHEHFSDEKRMEEGDDYPFRLHRLDRVDGEITHVTYPPDALDMAIDMQFEVR